MPLSRFGARILGSRGHSGVSQAGTPAQTSTAMGQNTAASQLITAQVFSQPSARFAPMNRWGRPQPMKRRSKRKAAKMARSNGGRKRKAKRPARLVKGSAAAKRYMASIRRKRKR